MNKVINVKENDPRYNALKTAVDAATDDDLIIVARSYKNRKDDRITPIDIINGIYFYIAYNLNDGQTAFLGAVTSEMVNKAKANMLRRARFGSMYSVVFSDGETFDNYDSYDELMNVVTLDCKRFGAGLLYCTELLKEIKRKIGNYYILPSSVDEIIVVPADASDLSSMTQLVRDVNATITDDVWLADEAFTVEEWL